MKYIMVQFLVSPKCWILILRMPPPQVNTLNCLVLESKQSLKDIPHGVQYYFVNSKRRFLVYFKHYQQMIDTMRALSQNNIRFYRRESILPDREELQQLVYHCNYRFKRQDLRKNLSHSTPYNQPKVWFDKYEKAKMKFQQPVQLPQSKNTQIIAQQIHGEEKKEKIMDQMEEEGIKNPQVMKILCNQQLLKQIFRSMNLG